MKHIDLRGKEPKRRRSGRCVVCGVEAKTGVEWDEPFTVVKLDGRVMRGELTHNRFVCPAHLQSQLS